MQDEGTYKAYSYLSDMYCIDRAYLCNPRVWASGSIGDPDSLWVPENKAYPDRHKETETKIKGR